MPMKRLIAIGALLLAGCGFSPMYGQVQSGQPVIGHVVVAEIEGRAGHVLKRELDRLLAVEGVDEPPHYLEIGLNERISGLAYRVDESTTRSELNLTANYRLRLHSGEVVRGSVRSNVVYDIPRAAFGEIAAQDDARERAAEVLAQRMRAELAIRISRTRRE
jgi:LPS-assembly lipoprotein